MIFLSSFETYGRRIFLGILCKQLLGKIGYDIPKDQYMLHGPLLGVLSFVDRGHQFRYSALTEISIGDTMIGFQYIILRHLKKLP